MTDYLPKFNPGSVVTFTTSADVTGGRLVSATGARLVGPSPAESATVLGVAGFDALAGEPVTVYLRPGGVHPLVAAGPIAAGEKVVSASAGRVQTAAALANPIGVALSDAAAAGVVDVQFI